MFWGNSNYRRIVINRANQKGFWGQLKWLVGLYMLATACPNGRLWNWLSLHPVPMLEFRHGAGAQVALKWAPDLCVHTGFVRSGAVHCFVLAAKVMLQNGLWQGEMEQLCTQSHIGYSRCEHNTILTLLHGHQVWTPPYTVASLRINYCFFFSN